MLQHIQEKLSDLTLNKFCKKFTRYFFPFFWFSLPVPIYLDFMCLHFHDFSLKIISKIEILSENI